MKNSFLTLVLAGLALCSEASTLLEYPVIELASGERQITTADTKLTVVLFFEPDCSWCFKQTRVFNDFIRSCNTDIQFIGLGVNGSRQKLKKEAWRQRADFPMYMASKEMIKAIGQVSTTPLTLLLDQSGNIISHARGYLPAKKWRDFMATHGVMDPACIKQITGK